MASNLLSEKLLPLTRATKLLPELLPERRNGKRPHVSCLYRWTKSGCRGVVLQSVDVGGTRCTSRAAIVRFIEAVTAIRSGVQPTSLPRSPSYRQAAAVRADRELERLGI